ncbi:MAG: hypothetical protein ABI867_22035 [Kofleriaceae bacterium]
MLEIRERGDVQFFFRPSVQPAEADTFTLGVQSFFLILSPAGGALHRRLRIGKKRLPESPRERFWARIERIGSLQRVLGGSLESESYITKTRGVRYQPGARPIAQGTYELVRHDDHFHFRYEAEAFDLLDAPEEIQLAQSGNFRILWKASSARATWTQHGDLAQLDDEGAQVVLVGSRTDDDQSIEALA